MSNQSVDAGAFKSVDIPVSWHRSDSKIAGRHNLVSFESPDKRITLSMLEQGRPISADGAKYFKVLLDKNASLIGPIHLKADQIKNLNEVMGNMADNQYTNPNPAGDPRSPAFHLSFAQLTPVHGKTVLEARGYFVDDDGKPKNYVRGVFISSDQNGKMINAFFLQSRSLASFTQGEKYYRDALKSMTL